MYRYVSIWAADKLKLCTLTKQLETLEATAVEIKDLLSKHHL